MFSHRQNLNNMPYSHPSWYRKRVMENSRSRNVFKKKYTWCATLKRRIMENNFEKMCNDESILKFVFLFLPQLCFRIFRLSTNLFKLLKTLNFHRSDNPYYGNRIPKCNKKKFYYTITCLYLLIRKIGGVK